MDSLEFQAAKITKASLYSKKSLEILESPDFRYETRIWGKCFDFGGTRGEGRWDGGAMSLCQKWVCLFTREDITKFPKRSLRDDKAFTYQYRPDPAEQALVHLTKLDWRDLDDKISCYALVISKRTFRSVETKLVSYLKNIGEKGRELVEVEVEVEVEV
ncbi:MAG: hypothetical protein IPP86_04895 [Bacteroidetes bacterium]|nr:hypothetical protein [Bacteroidota bacterium]